MNDLQKRSLRHSLVVVIKVPMAKATYQNTLRFLIKKCGDVQSIWITKVSQVENLRRY